MGDAVEVSGWDLLSVTTVKTAAEEEHQSSAPRELRDGIGWLVFMAHRGMGRPQNIPNGAMCCNRPMA